MMLERKSSIECLITAIVADYGRRAEEIAKKELSPRVIMEYRYYNTKIYNAVAEIVGESQADRYISDIGGRKGYPRNGDIYYSEAIYYRKKQACKVGIARALNLID
jgi:hypothetical protein